MYRRYVDILSWDIHYIRTLRYTNARSILYVRSGWELTNSGCGVGCLWLPTSFTRRVLRNSRYSCCSVKSRCQLFRPIWHKCSIPQISLFQIPLTNTKVTLKGFLLWKNNSDFCKCIVPYSIHKIIIYYELWDPF